MKLNCWPGCIARLLNVGNPANEGRFVDVLYRAPAQTFVGPNGERFNGELEPAWVIKSATPFTLQRNDGRFVHTSFGVALDRYLQPITPPPEVETVDTENEVTA